MSQEAGWSVLVLQNICPDSSRVVRHRGLEMAPAQSFCLSLHRGKISRYRQVDMGNRHGGDPACNSLPSGGYCAVEWNVDQDGNVEAVFQVDAWSGSPSGG